MTNKQRAALQSAINDPELWELSAVTGNAIRAALDDNARMLAAIRAFADETRHAAEIYTRQAWVAELHAIARGSKATPRTYCQTCNRELPTEGGMVCAEGANNVLSVSVERGEPK